VLLLLVHLYRVRDASLLRASLALSAHFAITAVAVGVHVWMARSSGLLTVHASPGGLASRVPRVAATCVYYVRKFLWPHPLATEYDFQAILDQRLALIASVLLVGAVFAVILWRGRRERSLAWLAVLAYLGALLPVMNLVEGNQAIADRYAQLPLLALAPLAIVPILVWLPRTASLAATAGVAVLLFGVSFPQVAVWRDHETLMRHVIDVNPRAEQALRNLGMQYSVAGRDEEALAVFQKLALVGDHFFHLEYQRGTIAFEQERWDDAERWLRSATRESQRGRLRYLADMKLGELYRMQQRRSEAIAAYENAQVELRRASGDHEWGWRETEVALRELRSRRPPPQPPTRDESKGSR
jgi:tetratricopeptide (TPR) repeat protein